MTNNKLQLPKNENSYFTVVVTCPAQVSHSHSVELRKKIELEVGIKMHALSSYFISAACVSDFIAVPTNIKNFKKKLFSFVCVLFLVMQSYSYACTVENLLWFYFHRQDNNMALIWQLECIKCNLISHCISLITNSEAIALKCIVSKSQVMYRAVFSSVLQFIYCHIA